MSLDVSSSHRHEDGSVALPKIGSTPSPSCQYKEGTFSAYEDEIVNELDFRQIEDTETSGNLPVIDRPQFALLVMLYLIQGVPIGLAFGTIPFLLKGSNLSFSQVGVFSLASYPYSLKLLWSPIVDSLYFKNIGRRRSWIIPVQAVSGLMLLFLSTQVDALFLDLEANLYRLTIVFFHSDFAMCHSGHCSRRLGVDNSFSIGTFVCFYSPDYRIEHRLFHVIHHIFSVQFSRFC